MRTSPAVFSVLLLIVSFLPSPVDGAELSQSLRLEGLGGEVLVESDLGNGSAVVVVWAAWSPRCREIVSRVNYIVHGWGEKARVLTVDFQEESQDIRRFLKGQETLEAPVYLDVDGLFSRKHRVTTLPGLLVFRDGAVTYRGGLPEDPGQVLEAGLQP